MPPEIPPVSFRISIASRVAFGGFTFAAFNPENIPAALMVMISPSLIESSMFFLQWKLLVYSIRFFIIRLRNYLSHTGKDNNHTNDADVSNASCCPTTIAFRLKNILTVVVATVVMDSSPSPIGFSAAVMASSSMFS